MPKCPVQVGLGMGTLSMKGLMMHEIGKQPGGNCKNSYKTTKPLLPWQEEEAVTLFPTSLHRRVQSNSPCGDESKMIYINILTPKGRH